MMNMKLIKLTDEHYIIVDDSEISVGDWITDKYKIWKWNDDCSLLGRKKVNYSTQPIEEFIDNEGIKRIGWVNIKVIELSEVKELIGEVDVEKKAHRMFSSSYIVMEGLDIAPAYRDGYVVGYNQALEDNKEKKYTEKDVIRIVEKSRETGLTAEYLMITFQPKTEWEVEFDEQGKLNLK